MQGFKPEQVRNALLYIDKEKRSEAYVTEWFFEKHVFPKVCKGQTSVGWCFVKPKNKKFRHWFKVYYDQMTNDVERLTDRQFVQMLKSRPSSDRFFLLYFNKSSGDFNLREIVEAKTGLPDLVITAKIPLPPKCDLIAIKKRADELKDSSCKQVSEVFSSWLNVADKNYLERLFFQRLLMNEGLNKQFPTDVDAIEISGETLTFHEFKRKNKCPHGCLTNGKAVDSTELFQIQGIYKKIQNQNESLSKKLEKSHNYKRDLNNWFGLDFSHLINFEYCQRNNINYIYTIWNSSELNKPKLNELFEVNLNPKQTVSILSLRVTPGDFRGVTYTTDIDSGSFHSKLRLQATIKESLFQEIKLN